MKHCALVLFVLVTAFYCGASRAQAQAEGDTQIAHQVLTELSSWQNIPSGINIEELQVSYQTGKLLEQDVEHLNMELNASRLLSKQILAHPQLSDQIRLMGLLGSIADGMGALQESLLDFAPVASQKPKYKAWSTRSSEALKQANHLAVEQIDYVLKRADQVEKSGCK